MKQIECRLKPVGTYKNDVILLDSAYSDGLLHLDTFSHAVVIYGENGFVSCNTVAIDVVDVKNGMIKTIRSCISDNSGIFDIKPYFPCEDRVKGSVSAESPQLQISRISDDGTIKPVGSIGRREGEFVLKLHDVGAASIQNCSHIRIFWWFDRFDKHEYRKVTQCNPPYENAPRTGIFASRSPVRPNPIAVTTARILQANEKEIRVTGLDCLENTPLIGILPYDSSRDSIDGAVVPPWLEHWPKWVDDSDYNFGKLSLRPSILENMLKSKVDREIQPDLFSEKRVSGRKENVILIRGARQNNLKGIDVEIPYNRIIAVTGISGSGKSSLAFDTIYTECRRRFLDVTGSGETVGKPDFDSIDGVLPAVAVSQKSIGRNPRSTVGTFTEMYDWLRILFASIGVRHCPQCGEAVIPMSVDEMVALLSGCREVEITDMTRQTVTGDKPHDGAQIPKKPRMAYLFRDNTRQIVEKALQTGYGALWASVDGGEPMLLQTTQMCYHCDRIMFAKSPAMFSFNNPESMCPVCSGYGVKLEIDAALIISNPDISILDGASAWWGKLRSFKKNPNHNWMKGEILALADELNVDLEKPWKQLPENFRQQALYGSGGRTVTLTFKNEKSGRNGDITRPVEGACACIKRLYAENHSDRIADAFMQQSVCSCCGGERLNREGRLVTIGNIRFPQTTAMTIAQLKNWCEKMPEQLTNTELQAASALLQKLHRCLCSCIDLGLGYLTLDRSIPSLSGGELQRLKLVSQLGSDISGLLYVLDEPTSGLHPKDYHQLASSIRRLREHGNTVLLVEHNGDIIKIADQIIDVGPGAGIGGGYLVAQGTPAEIMNLEISETGRYLSGKSRIAIAAPHDLTRKKWVRLSGIRRNNLKNIDVAFPISRITCVSGVSGSGKSTLVKGVLFPVVEKTLAGMRTDNYCDSVDGADAFARVVLADQSPIGRTPRSVPATYMGIMDELRNLFATTAEAESLGLTSGHFSFNSPLGQCENCHGDGMTAVAFMDDLWVPCPVCAGRRYKDFVLKAKFDGLNIAEVLQMSITQAAAFFKAQPKLSQLLNTMIEVGLGYLQLGQNSATLSGGEAQRLKLAANFCIPQRGKTLYLLDEPTTGLHFIDIQNLLLLVSKLAAKGNTVVIIEHNLDVIRCVDWVIDLGPEGGESGGNVVAQGTPEDISSNMHSHTGKYLKNMFADCK
jgi:excinuclease ABC subunit A